MYLTAASVAQKAIAFVYFTIVANQIGKAGQGDYFLALSVTTILSVVSDWGLSAVLIREIAHDPSQAVKLTRSTLGLKIPLILLGMGGAVALAILLNYDLSIIKLVALATLILAADAISLTFFGVLRGLQNLRYESLGIFVGQILSATAGLIALRFHPTLSVLILALLVGSVWNAIYSATRVAKHLGWKAILPSFDAPRAKQLLRLSLAFALASLFVKIYSYIDSILLKQFMGSEAVGTYSIAYKITYAFQFLPMAFIGGLYPAMASRFANGDKDGVAKIFDDAVWYTIILAVPITFGIASLSGEIIQAFYPKFYDAAVPLTIMIFALLVLFVDFPVGSLLNAARKQNVKTIIMGVTMIINAALNVLLIPRLGIAGAAVTAVIAFTFMLAAGLVYVPRLVPYPISTFLRRVLPVVFCGALMGGVVLLIKSYLPLPATILVGAAIYFIGLLLTRSLTIAQLRYIRRLIKPEPNGLEL